MHNSVVPFNPQYVKTVTMCVHISPVCNLKCKYCFKKVDGELSFDDVVRFVDCVLQIYPHVDRYIVDMSGAGEPLLRKELLFRIARYCRTLSDKYLREFLPTIVTNGTLLSEHTVEQLQNEGVLFGVSLDGTKKSHDKNRVFSDDSGSYDIVEKNVSSIKHKAYVGAAVTYSDGDLLQSFLSAFKLLPTVSMKPVRYTSNFALDVKAICEGYNDLVNFLQDKTLKKETNYLFSLLNGDDYLGKFIKRIVLGINVFGRCDAGIGRFALAGDKKIYCCPAATGLKDGVVGDLDNGINRSKIYLMWENLHNFECENCPACGVCGGECKIVSYNRYGNFYGIDPDMCAVKRHIFILASNFIKNLQLDNRCVFEWLKEACEKIDGYNNRDDQLISATLLARNKYSYSELKVIKDNDKQRFAYIFEQLNKIDK